MTLSRLLRAHGGWYHRGALLDEGWTPRRLLEARRDEGIDLLRRTWLVLPNAPEDVREAARIGGVVTSVSALDRYRLWVPPEMAKDSILHIAVRPDAHVRPGHNTLCYRARPIVGRSPRDLIDRIENVLAGVAARLPAAQAFAVWESAVKRELMTPEEVLTLPWRSSAAKALAAEISALSDSGVESTFVRNCRRAGIPVVQQVRIAGKPVDALIGRRLVVQLDGFAFHSDAAQRRRDIAHDRQLVAMGYTVLRYSYQDVMYQWPRIERELRAAMARGMAA
ncbi:endonuclease domain-containing protein [Microbacterium suaedae]|uniref:endonuclease domain-containing protein n=1 Tax=Microbacterium suaedae TaxID=2067813 RepID=UPI0013A65F21|nr:DUF559 domain-containing protein [Microbacterium suaedae]